MARGPRPIKMAKIYDRCFGNPVSYKKMGSLDGFPETLFEGKNVLDAWAISDIESCTPPKLWKMLPGAQIFASIYSTQEEANAKNVKRRPKQTKK